MVTQQEREILSTYQKIEDISAESYFADFVLRNPTNFPVSSYIMKFCNQTITKDTVLKDLYTRMFVVSTMNSMASNGNASVLYHMSDAFDQFNFTTFMLVLQLNIGRDKFKYFSIITEIGEDYLFSFTYEKLKVLVTTNFDDIIIMNAIEFQRFIIALNGRKFASFDEYYSFIVTRYPHYRIPTELVLNEKELPNERRYKFCLLITLLTGNQYQYREEIAIVYPHYETLLKDIYKWYGICNFITDGNESSTYLVDKTVKKSEKHIENAVDFGLLNKKLGI